LRVIRTITIIYFLSELEDNLDILGVFGVSFREGFEGVDAF
jgi:hypothetical protein